MTTRVTAVAILSCAAASLSVGSAPAAAQHPGGSFDRLTRPERTNFVETSSYADVMAFVEAAAAASPLVHLTTFGYTSEGRPLPLVVLGRVADASPEAVRGADRTRVFVQANIHAGEVCGKEALQILLRDLVNGRNAAWLDSLVLLFAPIYNADGNERVALTNRRGQHGPIGGMGQRPNAQGLDLNRDHTKLDSPEARSLVGMMTAYDPHVLVDLHTTNGTQHAYPLVYAPPLHPNTDPGIVRLLRNEWLPTVTRRIRDRYGWDTYYYGNLPWRGQTAERGWYTYDHLARYNTNYVGLRNRVGILSEAYAYATFEERVRATYEFVTEVVGYAYEHAALVRRVTDEADRRTLRGTELAVQATMERARDSVRILLGETVAERNPYSGETMLRRVDVRHPERMPEYGSFRATETAAVPASYVVPPQLTAVLERLAAHGIGWETVEPGRTERVERFAIDSTITAAREYQGHTERALYGRWETVEIALAPGSAVVSTAQPLGRLVFTLLEPRSDDGFLNWNLLDRALEGAEHYPVLRLPPR